MTSNGDSGAAHLDEAYAGPANAHGAISIVSASALLCEGLARLLAGRLNLELAGCYPIDQPTSALLPNPANHVVLLDGSADSAAVLRWAHYWRGLADPPCLVLIELPDDIDTIVACIELGATGFVLRGEPFEQIAMTIETARRGAAYCSPEVTAQVFARLVARRVAARTAPPPLTVREREVLRYIACHYSNQQIADALVIEVRTVKHHVHNILEKLKLQHRWEAAQVAADEGWLDDAPLELAVQG